MQKHIIILGIVLGSAGALFSQINFSGPNVIDSVGFYPQPTEKGEPNRLFVYFKFRNRPPKTFYSMEPGRLIIDFTDAENNQQVFLQSAAPPFTGITIRETRGEAQVQDVNIPDSVAMLQAELAIQKRTLLEVNVSSFRNIVKLDATWSKAGIFSGGNEGGSGKSWKTLAIGVAAVAVVTGIIYLVNATEVKDNSGEIRTLP